MRLETSLKIGKWENFYIFLFQLSQDQFRDNSRETFNLVPSLSSHPLGTRLRRKSTSLKYDYWLFLFPMKEENVG